LKISNAAVSGAKGDTTLSVSVHETKFVICTLNAQHPQFRLDLEFGPSDGAITFSTTGAGEVSLIGLRQASGDLDDMSDLDEDELRALAENGGIAEDSEEGEEEEEEEEKPQQKKGGQQQQKKGGQQAQPAKQEGKNQPAKQEAKKPEGKPQQQQQQKKGGQQNGAKPEPTTPKGNGNQGKGTTPAKRPITPSNEQANKKQKTPSK